MGVPGVMSVLRALPSAWTPLNLSGGVVIIDGNAMAMQAVTGGFADECAPLAWTMGGEVHQLEARLLSFLTTLRLHNVTVDVVFDG